MIFLGMPDIVCSFSFVKVSIFLRISSRNIMAETHIYIYIYIYIYMYEALKKALKERSEKLPTVC